MAYNAADDPSLWWTLFWMIVVGIGFYMLYNIWTSFRIFLSERQIKSKWRIVKYYGSSTAYVLRRRWFGLSEKQVATRVDGTLPAIMSIIRQNSSYKRNSKITITFEFIHLYVEKENKDE